MKAPGLKARIGSFDFIPLIVMHSFPPAAVNYTSQMPPIKNQLFCGSCYAFAAISLVEYQSRNSGIYESYSEQNLIDCDNATNGCDGGWPTNSLTYISDEGVSNGSTYVYEGESSICRRDSYPSIYKIENACEVDLENDEENLRKLVASVGPVAA